jgi:hypothetical protein
MSVFCMLSLFLEHDVICKFVLFLLYGCPRIYFLWYVGLSYIYTKSYSLYGIYAYTWVAVRISVPSANNQRALPKDKWPIKLWSINGSHWRSIVKREAAPDSETGPSFVIKLSLPYVTHLLYLYNLLSLFLRAKITRTSNKGTATTTYNYKNK